MRYPVCSTISCYFPFLLPDWFMNNVNSITMNTEVTETIQVQIMQSSIPERETLAVWGIKYGNKLLP